MSETEFYTIFLAILLYGTILGIAFIPLIDRWIDKWQAWRKKAA